MSCHVAIRADGGPDIGYGHLVRSGALAEVFLERGHTVTVATTTPSHADAVYSDGIATVQLPARGDPRPFGEWLDTADVDVVFTDTYPIDTEYQRAVRGRVPLAVLQDDAGHAVCADLFVNGNLYAPGLDYEFVGHPPETCLGTDYVLLRRDIRERAVEGPPWREQPERALVLMGGSDMTNQTPTVIRAFDGFDLIVDAIVGPGCSEKQEREIREAASKVSSDVHIARDPDDLPERMFHADFAVSTSSTTTYELLALGTPIISKPVVDNQEPIANALRERSVAIVLEREDSKAGFQRAIQRYITDTTLRKRRQKLGRELVDGRGTRRILGKIRELV
jgi:spore coat polysaccharide biosynthesis predicted glycosyltransferase SpsG